MNTMCLFGYTPREPVILPFKPINRPLKTDWYNGTTNNRPLDFFNSYSYDITDTHFLAFDEHFTDQSSIYSSMLNKSFRLFHSESITSL